MDNNNNSDVDVPEPLTEARKKELSDQYNNVCNTVNAIKDKISAVFPNRRHVRLVAVSKTHNYAVIKAVYDAGCRVFGENYVQEIIAKAPHLPQDIKWHFIGHLQSNKIKELLVGVRSLDTIESVDSLKLAQKLNNGVEKYRLCNNSSGDGSNGGDAICETNHILNVMVQVNTSGEESKYGVEPNEAAALCVLIKQQCPLLKVTGLMTIGMPDYTSTPGNFACLVKCREEAASMMGLASPDELDLSMGMSGDYTAAIKMGSTNIRVGTAVFGARTYQTH